MVQDVVISIDNLCKRRHVDCQVEHVHDAEAVQCSPALAHALSGAVRASEQVKDGGIDAATLLMICVATVCAICALATPTASALGVLFASTG